MCFTFIGRTVLVGRLQALRESEIESDNGNVHRAAVEIIVFKKHGAGGSVCNVLLSRSEVSHCPEEDQFLRTA